MSQRKRRSLIGSQGSASGDGGAGEGPGAPSEAASASEPEPVAAPPSAPPEPPAGAAAQPGGSEDEPPDPWAVPPTPPEPAPAAAQPADPFAAPADPFADASVSATRGAPDPFTGAGPAPEDPFGADPFGNNQAFGGDDIRAEVKEKANPAGRLYSSHGKAHDDTTDSGWSNSAFARHSDPSLPPGWGTPEPAPSRSSSLGAQKPIKAAFGEDDPPTEEQPSATFEDRAPAVGAPMNVPEPPPIPGLFDRFTPAPPAQRAGKSFSGGGDGRPKFEASPPPAPAGGPSYLVEEEPPKPKAESKPLPRPTPKKDEDEDEDDDDKPSGGIPFPLIAFGAVVVAGMFLGVVLLFVMNTLGGGDEPAPPPAPVVVPVPVAKPIVVPPPLATADTDAPAAGMSETTATTAPVDASAVAVTPEEPAKATTTTDPAKAGTPKASKPKTDPKSAGTPKPSGATGTLKIRSNRRVLVKVNGQPRDYSPLDLPIAPGTYTVSAALPGKPDSEQTVTVTLQSGAIEPVNFTF